MNPRNFDNYSRCLAAARDPAAVRKADYPSHEDFDRALDELTGILWDPEREPNYKA
jgi:hypothetical protein